MGDNIPTHFGSVNKDEVKKRMMKVAMNSTPKAASEPRSGLVTISSGPIPYTNLAM